jgi:hypothetical protein
MWDLGGQSVTGANFLRGRRFPLPILIQSTAPHWLIILSSMLYNRWTTNLKRPLVKKKISVSFMLNTYMIFWAVLSALSSLWLSVYPGQIFLSFPRDVRGRNLSHVASWMTSESPGFFLLIPVLLPVSETCICVQERCSFALYLLFRDNDWYHVKQPFMFQPRSFGVTPVGGKNFRN